MTSLCTKFQFLNNGICCSRHKCTRKRKLKLTMKTNLNTEREIQICTLII